MNLPQNLLIFFFWIFMDMSVYLHASFFISFVDIELSLLFSIQEGHGCCKHV